MLRLGGEREILASRFSERSSSCPAIFFGWEKARETSVIGFTQRASSRPLIAKANNPPWESLTASPPMSTRDPRPASEFSPTWKRFRRLVVIKGHVDTWRSFVPIINRGVEAGFRRKGMINYSSVSFPKYLQIRLLCVFTMLPFDVVL